MDALIQMSENWPENWAVLGAIARVDSARGERGVVSAYWCGWNAQKRYTSLELDVLFELEYEQVKHE
jgi:hypothetical protein